MVKREGTRMAICMGAAEKDIAIIRLDIMKQEIPLYSHEVSYTLFDQLATLGRDLSLW